MVIAAMRHMSGTVPAWALTWPDEPIAKRMNDAITADAWGIYNAFDSSVTTDVFSAFASKTNPPTLGGRVLSFVFSPYLRLSAANTAMAHRELIRAYSTMPPCSRQGPAAAPALARWNTFGRATLPADTLARSYGRVHAFLAHVEGTRLILQLRRGSADGIVDPCASRLWVPTVSAPGRFSVAASSPIATFGTGETFNLPQRHDEGGAPP